MYLVGEGGMPMYMYLPFERLDEAVRLVFYLEDLDGFVGGAGGQAAAVVVEDSIVLLSFAVSQSSCMRSRRDGRMVRGWAYVRSCHRVRSLILLGPAMVSV